MTTLDSLPRRSFHGNWKCKDVKEPQFLVLGMGETLGLIAEAVASRLDEVKSPDVHMETPLEVKRQPDKIEALRIVKVDRLVHRTATDVTLRRENDDVYVRLKVASRTWLKYLRYVLYGSLFISAWCATYGVFYSCTNTYESVVQAYLKQYSESSPPGNRKAHIEGIIYDEASHKWVKGREPLTIGNVFHDDPRLVFTQLAGPPTFIAVIIGVALRFLPPGFMRVVCRMVGWPTVEEFETMIAAHTVWVEGQLSTVLRRDFGVTVEQIMMVKHA
jgi:hypothetical protein